MTNKLVNLLYKTSGDITWSQAEKCTELTTNVSIKFQEWISDLRYVKSWGGDKANNGKYYKEHSNPEYRKYSTLNELFSYFIDNVYGK